MIAAIREIAAKHPGRVVAVVTHSGAINAAIADVIGAERSVISALDHTSVTTLQCTADGITVIAVNDNRHLNDPLPALPQG
jgi:broad specificity phosphatase PhoE